MKQFPLVVIVVLSAALVLLGIYARMEASKAEVNALTANKFKELLLEEKQVNEQLMEELLECQQNEEGQAELEE